MLRRGAVHGFLSFLSLFLSRSLGALQGAAVWDNADVHGVHENSVYDIVWQVVDAINSHPDLAPQFDPHDKDMLKELRDDFESISSAHEFRGAVAAVDGLMVGITRRR